MVEPFPSSPNACAEGGLGLVDTIRCDNGEFDCFGMWAGITMRVVSERDDMTQIRDVPALEKPPIPQFYPVVGVMQVGLQKTHGAAWLEEITVVAVAHPESIGHATVAGLANGGM